MSTLTKITSSTMRYASDSVDILLSSKKLVVFVVRAGLVLFNKLTLKFISKFQPNFGNYFFISELLNSSSIC